jgi:hypothetical protein
MERLIHFLPFTMFRELCAVSHRTRHPAGIPRRLWEQPAYRSTAPDHVDAFPNE